MRLAQAVTFRTRRTRRAYKVTVYTNRNCECLCLWHDRWGKGKGQDSSRRRRWRWRVITPRFLCSSWTLCFLGLHASILRIPSQQRQNFYPVLLSYPCLNCLYSFNLYICSAYIAYAFYPIITVMLCIFQWSRLSFSVLYLEKCSSSLLCIYNIYVLIRKYPLNPTSLWSDRVICCDRMCDHWLSQVFVKVIYVVRLGDWRRMLC